jgi:hypothetical protein
MLALTFSVALAGLIATGCSSGSTRTALGAQEGVPGSSPRASLKSHHTKFVMTGPSPTILPPFCDAAQHCVYPGTNVLHLTGDWSGDLIQGAVAVATASKFTSAGTNVFVGTIKGCGTGTAVLKILETGSVSPQAGAGRWEIAAGFGTGKLASLTGSGTGVGSVKNGARISTQTGTVKCGRG